MPELRVLREADRPYAVCPACDTRLDLPGLDGLRWTIRSPRDVADHLIMSMTGLEREELRVVILNTKNVVLRVVTVKHW